MKALCRSNPQSIIGFSNGKKQEVRSNADQVFDFSKRSHRRLGRFQFPTLASLSLPPPPSKLSMAGKF
jgi:hypothetical protein